MFCAISSSSVTLTTSLSGTNKSKAGSGDRWRKGDFFAALMWPFGFAVSSARLVSWKSCVSDKGSRGTWSPCGEFFHFLNPSSLGSF